MNLFSISLANIKNNKLSSLLSIILLALGTAIISMVLHLSSQIEEKFKRNVKGIDLVLGAKGSPLQLILSTIYHIDAPTGNIPLKTADSLLSTYLVKQVVPLALGDGFEGYRLVGTDIRYLSFYDAKVQEGTWLNAPFDVVLGHDVAMKLKKKLGDTFYSQHGLDVAAEPHHSQRFKIVGILAKNGSVLDQIILTSIQSIWNLHHQNLDGDTLDQSSVAKDTEGQHHEAMITAMLVKFKNPMMGMLWAKDINQNTALQTAVPAIEINRTMALMGIGIETFSIISILIIIVAGISVFISLYNAIKERKFELALMLTMGASRTKLFVLLLLEGVIIASLGWILGIFFGKSILYFVSTSIASNYHYQFEQYVINRTDGLLFLSSIIIGFLAALIPSLRVYKMDTPSILAEN